VSKLSRLCRIKQFRLITESIVSCELGVSCGVFTKVKRMTNGLLRSYERRSHCQNNFGNAVPRRSRWKRSLHTQRDSQCPLVRIRHQWWDTLSYGAATPVRDCSQSSSVILWPSAPHRPLTRPLPCSTGLHFGSSWWLETEDWSSQTILAENGGSWPATNEPRTGDVEAECSGQIGMGKLVTTATSMTSSWRRRILLCFTSNWRPLTYRFIAHVLKI